MKINNNGGFTLVELLIVICLMTVFFTIIGTFSSQKVLGESSLTTMAYNQIHGLYNDMMSEAMNGYAIKATVENKKDSKNLLPQKYVLYLTAGEQNNFDAYSYYKVYLQSRDYNGSNYTRIIDSDKIDIISNNQYLRYIIAKKTESDPGVNLNFLGISFENPTSKEFFYSNTKVFVQSNGPIINPDDSINTISEFPTLSPDTNFEMVDLVYYNLEGKKTFTYRIFKNKRSYKL